MSKYNVIAGAISIIVSMLGFFLAFRAELKKHTDEIVKKRLEEEKRHFRNECRIYGVKRKLSDVESYLTKRLDRLAEQIGELNKLIFDFIKGKQ